MNNSNNTNFYFGISEDKIYICFLDYEKNEFKKCLNFDIPDNLSNNLNALNGVYGNILTAMTNKTKK